MSLSLDNGNAQTLIYYSLTNALRGVVGVYPIASGSKGARQDSPQPMRICSENSVFSRQINLEHIA